MDLIVFGQQGISNMNTELKWLSQFYPVTQLKKIAPDQLKRLYDDTKIKSVSIGDLQNKHVESYLINSPDGFVKSYCWRNKGEKPCVSITTTNKQITASNDHFFEMSTGKWKYASFIFPGEKIKSKDGLETVIDIEDAGIQTVYDFHIDHPEHRYYTNDLSSHNSGAGKSLFLQNLAINWVEKGYNVIYISLELSEDLCGMRLDSMLTGYSTKQLFKNMQDVALKIIMKSKKAGKLQLVQLPNGINVNDLKAYVKEYQIQNNIVVDGVLLDYLDLMNPAKVKISSDNISQKDKHVSEELRNFAMEGNYLFATASQLNRCLALDTKVIANGKKINIVDVNEGDWIESNEGPVRVTHKYPVTTQPVYRIKTKAAKMIECSANHKIPTANGVMTINSGLKIGDKLCSVILPTGIFEMDDDIESIDYIGEHETIDIDVSGNRLFYANEILVHNSSVDEVEFDHSHIAGGLSKIQTADNVIGIFSSRAMRERGRVQIQFMKTRSSSGVGNKVDLGFNVESLRIRDLEPDEDDAEVHTSNALYDKLSKSEAAKAIPQTELAINNGDKLKAILRRSE